jgi:deoxyadenosine/deoxycytidine kinase
MHLPQTASELLAECEAIRKRDIELKQWANDYINEYLSRYVPLFFDYCDKHGVDTVEPETVFKFAGAKFIEAPTAETYLIAQMKIH